MHSPDIAAALVIEPRLIALVVVFTISAGAGLLGWAIDFLIITNRKGEQ
jgi:hypothetical protein